MHNKVVQYYCFIERFDTNIINKLPKKTCIIYRNYEKIIDQSLIIKIKNFCKSKKIKFVISNDIKLAIKLNLDGVYIPSFNKLLNIKFFKTKKNFIFLGSAHNLFEIKIKENQNISTIFLAPIFKNKGNRNKLGIYRFLNFMKLTKKNIVSLGGINQKNIKLINMLNLHGIAGISLFNNKTNYK